MLVVCPSHKDHSELVKLADSAGYHLDFHDYASIELEELVAPEPSRVQVRPVLEVIKHIVGMAIVADVKSSLSQPT
jgi:hypothetical protein